MTDGIYDKFGLIDSMVVELNQVTVSGVQNMRIIIETIQKLGALRDGLKKEDEQRAADHDKQRQDL